MEGLSVKATRALRGLVVVVVAAAALALSGCATADTAAVVNGTRISERDAQEAARQIQEAQPNSTITTPDAVAALIMAQFINQVADSVGKGLSDSAAKAAIPGIENPSPATLELVRSSLAWNQMTNDEHIKAVEAASNAQITINPRYGTFDPKAVRFNSSKPNWIKAEPTSSPTG
jgi:parvulin-like peptidyl-prolyl isomerase